MFSRIFRDEEVSAPTGTATQRSRSLSIISHDLCIFGDLTTIGGIQIEGRIEGDVSASAVTIGEKASVQGVVRADEVIVRGSVDGEIRARTVALSKTARVSGNILHYRISIEAGAYIDGRCVRQEESTPLFGVTDPPPALVAMQRGEKSQDTDPLPSDGEEKEKEKGEGDNKEPRKDAAEGGDSDESTSSQGKNGQAGSAAFSG